MDAARSTLRAERRSERGSPLAGGARVAGGGGAMEVPPETAGTGAEVGGADGFAESRLAFVTGEPLDALSSPALAPALPPPALSLPADDPPLPASNFEPPEPAKA